MAKLIQSAAGLAEEHQRASDRGLSETIWDLDWSRLLPLDVGDGIVVTRTCLGDALPFMQAHYAEIFEESPDDHRFWREPMSPARLRYYERVGDFFAFRHGDRMVGLLIGMAGDWSSYYLRSGGVLKVYQGVHFIHRFIRRLCGWLQDAGVTRIELDTPPSNLTMIQLLTRARFNVSGIVFSERWGVLVRLTKFLDPAVEDVFLRQYCCGVPYQLRARGAAGAQGGS